MAGFNIGDKVFIYDGDYYGKTGMIVNFEENRMGEILACVQLDDWDFIVTIQTRDLETI